MFSDGDLWKRRVSASQADPGAQLQTRTASPQEPSACASCPAWALTSAESRAPSSPCAVPPRDHRCFCQAVGPPPSEQRPTLSRDADSPVTWLVVSSTVARSGVCLTRPSWCHFRCPSHRSSSCLGVGPKALRLREAFPVSVSLYSVGHMQVAVPRPSSAWPPARPGLRSPADASPEAAGPAAASGM